MTTLWLGGARTVSGDVVDFQTNEAIASGATVATSGLVPAPKVTVEGATFTNRGHPGKLRVPDPRCGTTDASCDVQ